MESRPHPPANDYPVRSRLSTRDFQTIKMMHQSAVVYGSIDLIAPESGCQASLCMPPKNVDPR